VGQATYVALLRGINLGARNKVAMADLRELFTELGAEDVSTYVQSGNVVFSSGLARAKLEKAVVEKIKDSLGLELAVVVLTEAELARVVTANPFAKAQSDPLKLHVTFLGKKPAAKNVGALKELEFEPDEFEVAPKAVYLHCPQGYGRSKLSNAFFEKQLGVPATTRNWRTVTTLAELAGNTKQ
jgi:uncharacterized protein (DUF1697 family)